MTGVHQLEPPSGTIGWVGLFVAPTYQPPLRRLGTCNHPTKPAAKTWAFAFGAGLLCSMGIRPR